MIKELREFYKNNGCGEKFSRKSKKYCDRIVFGKCGSQIGLCPKCEETFEIKNNPEIMTQIKLAQQGKIKGIPLRKLYSLNTSNQKS